MKDKPTHPFDVVFGLGLAAVLFALFAPLEFVLVRHFTQGADPRAAYSAGALDMCYTFAAQAGVPRAQAAPVCAEMAGELSVGYAPDAP